MRIAFNFDVKQCNLPYVWMLIVPTFAANFMPIGMAVYEKSARKTDSESIVIRFC